MGVGTESPIEAVQLYESVGFSDVRKSTTTQTYEIHQTLVSDQYVGLEDALSMNYSNKLIFALFLFLTHKSFSLIY